MMTALPCLNQLLQGVVLTELSFTHIVTFIQNKPQTIPDKWKKVKIQSHIFSSNFQGLTLIPPQMQYTNNANKCRQKISFEHQKIGFCWCSAFVLILHKLCYAWPWGYTKCHFAFASHLTHPCIAWHESINWDSRTQCTDLSTWLIHTGCAANNPSLQDQIVQGLWWWWKVQTE